MNILVKIDDLCQTDESHLLIVSQNSLCVTTKLAQVIIERENGCLGLTLRGGSEFPIIVTSVRPFGPAYKTSRIKPGDRVLRVDNVSFLSINMSQLKNINF